jgi:hypothetical protein
LLNGKCCFPREKKEAASGDCAIGGVDSCATNAVMAGAWVKPEKQLKSHHELLLMNLSSSESGHLRISAQDLARTLKANDLELVVDGECFRMVQRT